MNNPITAQQPVETVGGLLVVPFKHPQGCRSYLVAEPTSRKAVAIDPHLDLVNVLAERVRAEGWSLSYVIDTHTHADHPSGAGALAPQFSSTRVAHPKSNHVGVTRKPEDGEALDLGDKQIIVRHAPGHTPDHVVLVTDGALFSGDTLHIGGVARTDFLGGDAGQLFDTLQNLLSTLSDDIILFPGHDYEGRVQSTLGLEKDGNPWLAIRDRSEFVEKLTANPRPQPANMKQLLRLNCEGMNIPERIPAADLVAYVSQDGAGSVIDVRTPMEVATEQVPGSHSVPLDEINNRVDEILRTAAPRFLLCRSGARANKARDALTKLGIGGLTVVEGGLEAYRASGGVTVKGAGHMSLERQVRIAAGTLVLIGVALGFVHPAFFALAAFVGAGLTFAGITDRCGMALILAKMPWNKASDRADSKAGGTCAASAPSGSCAASPPGTTDKD